MKLVTDNSFSLSIMLALELKNGKSSLTFSTAMVKLFSINEPSCDVAFALIVWLVLNTPSPGVG